MTPEETKKRLDELAKTIAFANSLGVRAAVVGDIEEAARAKAIYEQAMAEIKQLDSGAAA